MTKKNYRIYFIISLYTVAFFFNPFLASLSFAEDENEETYSINLVQTAEVAKEIVELENKKVLTETYTAKEGDHIWQILRKKDSLKNNKLGDVLKALKKLNPSLANIDLIHPGEKIVIPLVITPISGKISTESSEETGSIPLDEIEDLEYYTVSQGDSLIKVINRKYSIPGDELYDEYLNRLRKLNPDLKDLNHIYPGQRVRLPIYSPKIVRGTIKEKPEKLEKDDRELKLQAKETGEHLGRIFNLIGEEWLHEGKHFIPLQTGGQIDLNAETYPIINLRNGEKIIVDLFDSLPARMADLIRSNWGNYQIVHIEKDDDLRRSIGKILSVCNYDNVFASDESLLFEKGLKIELTADWIIRLFPDSMDNEYNIICLNLIEENSGTVPLPLKTYLEGYGVKIIEYPPAPGEKESTSQEFNFVTLDNSRKKIIEKLFELNGQEYTEGRDIPIYEGEDSDFNLVIKADYFFKRKGKDYIIDLTGLGTEIANLLKDQKFNILTLADETETHEFIAKTLDFFGVESEKKEQIFFALPENRTENVKIVIPGILFRDSGGESNFFSSIHLAPDIARFLSMKVDNIFHFDQSSKAR